MSDSQAEEPPEILDKSVTVVTFAEHQVRETLALIEKSDHQNISILDFSARLGRGKRSFPWPDVENLPFDRLSTENLLFPSRLDDEAMLIAFNDANPFLRQLWLRAEARRTPRVSLVEGPMDFGNVLDSLGIEGGSNNRWPQQNSDAVFLPGMWSERFFPEHRTFVIGMQRISDLMKRRQQKPKSGSILINLNYSYGVLQHHGRGFLEQVESVCRAMGLTYCVSRHPRDDSNLEGWSGPLTHEALTDAIVQHRLVISRFSTAIVEALALGVPAIYFNPFGEQVDDLLPPFGAFLVARTSEELSAAIAQTLAAELTPEDVRFQAREFLFQHAGIDESVGEPRDRFWDAVNSVASDFSGARDAFRSREHARKRRWRPGPRMASEQKSRETLFWYLHVMLRRLNG